MTPAPGGSPEETRISLGPDPTIGTLQLSIRGPEGRPLRQVVVSRVVLLSKNGDSWMVDRMPIVTNGGLFELELPKGQHHLHLGTCEGARRTAYTFLRRSDAERSRRRLSGWARVARSVW